MFTREAYFEDNKPFTGYRDNVNFAKFVYSGEFKNGLMHGKGTAIYENIEYTGRWDYGVLKEGTEKRGRTHLYNIFIGTFHNVYKRKFGVCCAPDTHIEFGYFNEYYCLEKGIIKANTCINYRKNRDNLTVITKQHKHHTKELQKEYPHAINDEMYPNHDLIGLCRGITAWSSPDDRWVFRSSF